MPVIVLIIATIVCLVLLGATFMLIADAPLFVLFLSLVGSILPILGIGLFFASKAKNQGTKFLYKDLQYLGYSESVIEKIANFGSQHYAYNMDALVISGQQKKKPLKRWFALLAYRGDIAFSVIRIQRSNVMNYCSISDNEGAIEKNQTEYINIQLRKEVYDAISFERKLFKAGCIKQIKSNSYPLASYLFVTEFSEKTNDEVDRIKFFYENQYPLTAAKQLKNANVELLQELVSLPPTWVIQTLAKP